MNIEIISDIPVIKTFSYRGNCYLYDTFTNRLFQVSKEHYLEINSIKNIGLEKYKSLNKKLTAYDDILKLINKGLLKSNFVKEVQHPEINNIDFLLERCINDVVFQVTQDCNFRCRYCLYANDTKTERNHSKVNMSLEMAKKCIDFVYDHSIDSEKINLSFYGGEPLLNFNTIKYIVDYANELFYSKSISYAMTINGSLLTDEIIEYIVKHNFSISISLDGPIDIQNRHRKFFESGNGTFDIVYSNVKKLKTNYKEYFDEKVHFLPVIMDDENYKNILNFFKDLNVETDKITPLKANLSGMDYILSNTGFNNSNLDADDKNNIEINSGNEEHLKYIYSQKNYIPSIWHHSGQCVLGIQRLFIDVNGIFYPCEKITEDETLSLGNIDSGFNMSRINKYLNIGKLSENDCRNCWAMRFCEICVALCNDIDKKTITAEQKSNACKGQKEKALWFLKRYIKESLSLE